CRRATRCCISGRGGAAGRSRGGALALGAAAGHLRRAGGGRRLPIAGGGPGAPAPRPLRRSPRRTLTLAILPRADPGPAGGSGPPPAAGRERFRLILAGIAAGRRSVALIEALTRAGSGLAVTDPGPSDSMAARLLTHDMGQPR